MTPYIDIHTHQPVNLPEEYYIGILNRLLHETKMTTGNKISAGWHPWYLNSFSFDTMKAILRSTIQEENIIAIGECGLDRACQTDFELQKKVFCDHISIAKKTAKPLIVHCVRAYSDLLEMLKQEKFMGNLIIHDYRGNTHQTKELLKFNCWFSFGKSILYLNPKIISTLSSIPPSRIFFETDHTNLSIEEIYKQAAKVLSIEIDLLKLRIKQNFLNCI